MNKRIRRTKTTYDKTTTTAATITDKNYLFSSLRKAI
jgi:hypothetical protein